jgi:hypothetical protein
MGGLNFKEGIVGYYLFQKKLSDYLNKRNYAEDEFKIKDGYLIHPDWIDNWRKIINYDGIKVFFKFSLNLNESNLYFCKDVIEDYFEKNLLEEEIIMFLSQVVKTNYFEISQKKIFDEEFLINMIPEDLYKAMKINEKNYKIKLKYIFKKRMIIFAIEDLSTMKIIITDTTPYFTNEKVVNLTWKFYDTNIYYDKLNIFEKKKF